MKIKYKNASANLLLSRYQYIGSETRLLLDLRWLQICIIRNENEQQLYSGS